MGFFVKEMKPPINNVAFPNATTFETYVFQLLYNFNFILLPTILTVGMYKIAFLLLDTIILSQPIFVVVCNFPALWQKLSTG